jgi:hypothetical protein
VLRANVDANVKKLSKEKIAKSLIQIAAQVAASVRSAELDKDRRSALPPSAASLTAV